MTSSSELRSLLKKTPVVIVVFTSSGCPACMMYKPVAEEASRLLKGVAEVVEYMVDYDPEPAFELGIMGTPATVVYVNGEPVEGFVGYVDLPDFLEFLARVLERVRPNVAQGVKKVASRVETGRPRIWM